MILRDEPYAVDVVRREHAFEGKIWAVCADTFRYGESELRREYIAHGGAVAILALDDQRRVLLLQQYRHPIGARDWELPAGLLDEPGESEEDAARRELAEEADLRADRLTELTAFHPSPGSSAELIRVFLAEGLNATGETFDRTEEEADIALRWVPLDEAVSAVQRGEVRNATTVIGVLLARNALAERDRG